MASTKVELLLNPVGAKCRLMIDGKEVENCRSIIVRASVGELSTVSLELINVEASILGEIQEGQKKVVDVTPLDAGNRRYKMAG